MPDEARRVKVWDPFVRLSHWILVVAFLFAYAIGDDLLTPHVWLGYLAGAVVVLRVFWGLVGSQHARLTDFVYPPRVVFGYLADLALFRARRYLGHGPAGGAMALALWLFVSLSVASGIVAYAYRDLGPLAPYLGPGVVVDLAPIAPALADGKDKMRASEKPRKNPIAKAWEEAHEIVSAIALWLVVVHVVGVLWASLVHRENLTRGMIDGRKRALE
jgi:cytochrome b